MAIVRRDKVKAGYVGNIESVVHTANMTNGVFVALGSLVTGERELHNVKSAGIDVTKDNLLFVNSPEVMYDERLQKLTDFVIEAGTPARAYYLEEGDVITLTTDLFTGTTPVVNDIVEPKGTGGAIKLEKNATPTAKLQLQVIETDSLGLGASGNALVLKVIKA